MSIALQTNLKRKFTVDEYHALIDAGDLTEKDRVELLQGRIVEKMSHDPPHDVAVDLTQNALAERLPAGWRVRVQSAVTTSDSEPDVAVVRGLARRYLRRHPGPRDIGMLAEVADATLQFDRTVKYRIYARCRIAIY